MTTKGNNIMARGKSLVHIVTNEVNVPKVMVEVHYLQLIMNNKTDNGYLLTKENNTPRGTNSNVKTTIVIKKNNCQREG
jgi:hypothetical protein